jgi:Asp-tRNA(Asn)/Glu-tRNA(Gln) amidotransferase C subunit
MNIDQLKQQQLQLLARKALIADEIAQIEKALGQIAAILQFAEATPSEPVAPAE